MTLREHKLHFELRGLLTFFAAMLPNLIWFAVPAPDDKLRTDSITGAIDAAGSVIQAAMVFARCFIIYGAVNFLL